MYLGFIKKYSLFLLVLAGGVGLGFVQFILFERLDDVEVFSVFSEGFAMCLALYGLFVIQGLKHSRAEYVPLMTGFTALFVSLLTDTLDELVDHPDVITFFFEDIFQVTGYVFIIIGLRQWVRHNLKDEGY